MNDNLLQAARELGRSWAADETTEQNGPFKNWQEFRSFWLDGAGAGEVNDLIAKHGGEFYEIADEAAKTGFAEL